MEYVIAWLTDTRILGIVFCAAGISVLRAVFLTGGGRDRRTRRKIG